MDGSVFKRPPASSVPTGRFGDHRQGEAFRGEGPDFVADQRTAPGGEFALNTNGGGLSYSHPGMYGSFLLVEAVRQLRGECGDRQVYRKGSSDQPAATSIVNGTGGSLSSTGTVVLATG